MVEAWRSEDEVHAAKDGLVAAQAAEENGAGRVALNDVAVFLLDGPLVRTQQRIPRRIHDLIRRGIFQFRAGKCSDGHAAHGFVGRQAGEGDDCAVGAVLTPGLLEAARQTDAETAVGRNEFKPGAGLVIRAFPLPSTLGRHGPDRGHQPVHSQKCNPPPHRHNLA
ncbi:hypothetical protein J8C02_08325 [Chloracidobacterium sp. MS 40/45]|uniref:hypothetical protein n=1 Tax=Chloracidobacterium aggregatum TaxID=2851959 RepID=UPI001B8B8579|nr:hypothetical protein [Chloracidobacterium aggregatum]QUV99428.1 hypothetical protein J8C02_08325 [Chloracidobacterium sp. MS 40/45]